MTNYGRDRESGLVDELATFTYAPTIWFKASRISLNDGDLVDNWPNYGNSNYDASSTGSDRPTFNTNIVNGLPVVGFSAAQFMSFLLVTYATGMWFVVWRRTNSGNNDVVLGDTGHTYSYLQYSTTVYTRGSGAGGSLSSMTAPMPASQFYIKSCIYNGSQHLLHTNGFITAQTSNSGGSRTSVIGGSLSGEIAEVRLYVDYFDQSYHDTVVNSLKSTYGII